MDKKRILLAIALLAAACLTGEARRKPQMHVIESDNLRASDTILVFSPAKAKRNVPTLFLLHGWSGCYRDWSAHMDLQKLSDDTGFRIICPDGFYDSWYLDKTDSTGMKWRKFFWEELWPLMDGEYGLDSEFTFIDGLSMGGHGAMNIYLDHPERFRGAGSMSGVLDLRNAGGSRILIPAMIGADDIDSPICRAQSAVNRLERALPEGVSALKPGEDRKVLVVSCGCYDTTFLPASEAFADRCNELGLRVVELYTPARHRWGYWTWVVRYHMEIFRQTALENSELGWEK
ncbi:MAG: hypothetical protein HUJ94_04230 [Bacteroidales bacterium]|nr:hypothetical protein [Bacteroidales bacterium]